MAEKIYGFLPASVAMPTDRQRLFARLLAGILIDLVVLNLFNEYWDLVAIDTFTLSLLAAVLLQLLLKATIIVEHWLGRLFRAGSGALMTFLRLFCAWLVLFLSKFVILEALDLAFGDSVRFGGPLDGLVVIVVVIMAMILAEEAVVRLYRRLG